MLTPTQINDTLKFAVEFDEDRGWLTRAVLYCCEDFSRSRGMHVRKDEVGQPYLADVAAEAATGCPAPIRFCPFCRAPVRFASHAAYMAEVRKKFPKAWKTMVNLMNEGVQGDETPRDQSSSLSSINEVDDETTCNVGRGTTSPEIGQHNAAETHGERS